jgi:Na+-driven multidrug efflux pump
LQVVAWSMPSLATVLVLSGALRGAGDTRWLFVITLIGFVGVRIPFALWLACEEIYLPLVDATIAGWGLGVFGAWYAMVADVIVRSLLMVFRFWQGVWKEVEV